MKIGIENLYSDSLENLIKNVTENIEKKVYIA